MRHKYSKEQRAMQFIHVHVTKVHVHATKVENLVFTIYSKFVFNIKHIRKLKGIFW